MSVEELKALFSSHSNLCVTKALLSTPVEVIHLLGSHMQLQEYGTKYNNQALRCQNPWFLPFEVIDEMWNIPGTT